MPPTFPSPAEVLPHRGSLLLLREIIDCAEDHLRAVAMVAESSSLGRFGMVPVIVAVEMAAQAAAYHSCVGETLSGSAPAEKGYLVRLRNVELGTATIQTGAAVSVRVDRAGGAGALSMFNFECLLKTGRIASGALSLLRG